LLSRQKFFVLLQATEKTNRWVSGNFMFFRMHHISDIYFVGGFGTVQWVDVGEYVSAKPDEIVTSDSHHTLQVGALTYHTQKQLLWVPLIA
jgi:nitrate reductase NapE component